MIITLLRHAQTTGNVQKQYIGHTDLPLNEEGMALARRIAKNNEVKTVHTSALVRTVQTAHILYPEAEIIEHAGLNEMHFGRFEGQHWRELSEDRAYQAWLDSGCALACPDGESKKTFTQRCVDTFNAIVTAAAEREESELHVVVHGGTIMAIMSELATPLQEYFAWTTDFCGGYLLEWQTAPQDKARPLQLIQSIRPKDGHK